MGWKGDGPHARKVKKLNLLEFTGGCRMSGPFTKVGLKQDVTRRYIAAVNVVLRHSDKSVENPRFQLDRVFFPYALRI
jgi:hypothetical protein